MTFEQWLTALDRIAQADGCVMSDGRSYTDHTGRDCWQDAFDDGLAPAEAWSEEKYAAAVLGDV